MKGALFGGTLLSAGLAAGSANAQELEFALNAGGYGASSYTTAYGYDGLNYEPYVQDIAYSPSVTAGPSSQASNGWSASASVTDTTISVTAYGGPAALGQYANAFGRAYAYVTQSEDTVVSIDWDFANEVPGYTPAYSYLLIFNFTTSEVAFSVDPVGTPASPVTGSEEFTLLAGNSYGITLVADVFEGGDFSAVNGSAFATLEVIPSPGTVAMIGAFGGAIARRRRR